MPKEYQDIKKSYMDKGKSKEEAESIAAATYDKHIRKHKKDKRPIGNKAQQEAGSAASESFKLIDDLLIENTDGINVIPKGSNLIISENMNTKWSEIPKSVRQTVWSYRKIPSGYDREFPIEMIDVEPLYQKLTDDNDFNSCNVYDDEWEFYKVDLRKPIMIDKRFNGLQANVADGLHRIMVAHHKGIKQLPSIDLTPMFMELGLLKAEN